MNKDKKIILKSYNEVMETDVSILRRYAIQNGIEIHPASGLEKHQQAINDYNEFRPRTGDTLTPPKVSDEEKSLADIVGKNPQKVEEGIDKSLVATQTEYIKELEKQVSQFKEEKKLFKTSKVYETCDTPNGVLSIKQAEKMYGMKLGENPEDNARKLVRIKITSNNPQDAEIDSKQVCFGSVNLNNGVPFRRILAFNSDKGCFVENLVYQNLLLAKHTVRSSKKVGPRIVITDKVISAFSIEVLAIPTEEELQKEFTDTTN